MKSIATEEQETVIQISRESDEAVVWTSDKTMMTRIDKLVENDESPWRCVDIGKNEEYGILTKEYKVPKRLISFRKTTVKMTEEEKARRVAHLINKNV